MDEEQERQVSEAALRFVRPDAVIRTEKLGGGKINDTYLIKDSGPSFVLQRINNHVFPRPELVVENFATVTAHLAARNLCPQWQDIRMLPTLDGRPFHRDQHGRIWRAQSYIDKTASYPIIDSVDRARQVGWALGHFHRLAADLPAKSLHETLPGFHVLASYLNHFDKVRRDCPVPPTPEIIHCFDIVEKYRMRMHALRLAEKEGRLIPHVMHGDPKADNILFDRESGRAVCLIDLDTVRPGLLLYDIGDCLRSCCNPSGEQGSDPGPVLFDIDMALEILAGYTDGAGQLFTPQDRACVFNAVCLLSFELGLRFLTDYLDGNRYFKIENEGENLFRALRQFHLLTDLIAKGDVFQ
jgi:Ser/Thr protein kinase RdoA (MazF antagonist)